MQHRRYSHSGANAAEARSKPEMEVTICLFTLSSGNELPQLSSWPGIKPRMGLSALANTLPRSLKMESSAPDMMEDAEHTCATSLLQNPLLHRVSPTVDSGLIQHLSTEFYSKP